MSGYIASGQWGTPSGPSPNKRPRSAYRSCSPLLNRPPLHPANYTPPRRYVTANSSYHRRSSSSPSMGANANSPRVGTPPRNVFTFGDGGDGFTHEIDSPASNQFANDPNQFAHGPDGLTEIQEGTSRMAIEESEAPSEVVVQSPLEEAVAVAHVPKDFGRMSARTTEEAMKAVDLHDNTEAFIDPDGPMFDAICNQGTDSSNQAFVREKTNEKNVAVKKIITEIDKDKVAFVTMVREIENQKTELLNHDHTLERLLGEEIAQDRQEIVRINQRIAEKQQLVQDAKAANASNVAKADQALAKLEKQHKENHLPQLLTVVEYSYEAVFKHSDAHIEGLKGSMHAPDLKAEADKSRNTAKGLQRNWKYGNYAAIDATDISNKTTRG